MNQHVEALKKAVWVVAQRQERKKRHFVGKIISGRGKKGDMYSPGGVSTFETTLAEGIITEVLRGANSKSCRVGWETAYPPAWKSWSQSKLDLGLDFVHGSEYMFRVAVEVKRRSLHLKKLVSYGVWGDIFKLYGYRDKNPDVGRHKFMVLFFDHDKCKMEHAIDRLNDAFVNRRLLTEHMKMHTKAKTPKSILRHFIQKRLDWSKADTRKVLGVLKPWLGEGKCFVRIEPITAHRPIFLGKTIGVAMLRVLDREELFEAIRLMKEPRNTRQG